jgi:hypothetical protein
MGAHNTKVKAQETTQETLDFINKTINLAIQKLEEDGIIQVDDGTKLKDMCETDAKNELHGEDLVKYYIVRKECDKTIENLVDSGTISEELFDEVVKLRKLKQMKKTFDDTIGSLIKTNIDNIDNIIGCSLKEMSKDLKMKLFERVDKFFQRTSTKCILKELDGFRKLRDDNALLEQVNRYELKKKQKEILFEMKKKIEAFESNVITIYQIKMFHGELLREYWIPLYLGEECVLGEHDQRYTKNNKNSYYFHPKYVIGETFNELNKWVQNDEMFKNMDYTVIDLNSKKSSKRNYHDKSDSRQYNLCAMMKLKIENLISIECKNETNNYVLRVILPSSKLNVDTMTNVEIMDLNVKYYDEKIKQRELEFAHSISAHTTSIISKSSLINTIMSEKYTSDAIISFPSVGMKMKNLDTNHLVQIISYCVSTVSTYFANIYLDYEYCENFFAILKKDVPDELKQELSKNTNKPRDLEKDRIIKIFYLTIFEWIRRGYDLEYFKGSLAELGNCSLIVYYNNELLKLKNELSDKKPTSSTELKRLLSEFIDYKIDIE